MLIIKIAKPKKLHIGLSAIAATIYEILLAFVEENAQNLGNVPGLPITELSCIT